MEENNIQIYDYYSGHWPLLLLSLLLGQHLCQRALHGDTGRVTFKYPQTRACDLARLQGIQSAKPVLLVVVVAEAQSESEISLGLLGDLLVFLFVFPWVSWEKRGRPHSFLLTKTHGS